MIRGYLAKYLDRAAFFAIVARYFSKYSSEYALIEKAYVTAKREFRDKVRDQEGVRYFEHLRGVALILMLHLRVRDVNVIVAALLHDIMEDIHGWTEDRLALEFNPDVAMLVFGVTKPDVSYYGGDKNARDRDYHLKLNMADRRTILIKLADRMHNLLTLWATTEEKQKRKVRETQDFYLPIAEKHTVLIHELEAAIAEIMDSWIRVEPVPIQCN